MPAHGRLAHRQTFGANKTHVGHAEKAKDRLEVAFLVLHGLTASLVE